VRLSGARSLTEVPRRHVEELGSVWVRFVVLAAYQPLVKPRLALCTVDARREVGG
jgi:hypothetical protein